jgi:hypothetical protein
MPFMTMLKTTSKIKVILSMKRKKEYIKIKPIIVGGISGKN